MGMESPETAAGLMTAHAPVRGGSMSAFLQYDFVDGIARLDAMTRYRERRPVDARHEVKERIRVSVVGLLAFLFLTLTALMFVRLLV